MDALPSIDADGKIVLYKYIWGDGTESNWTTTSQMSYNYTKGGIYAVGLKVKDNFMQESSLFIQHISVNQRPQAYFEVTSLPNNIISLNLLGSNDIDGDIRLFIIDYQDGEIIKVNDTSALPINHHYQVGGYYNISLVVIDNLGLYSVSYIQSIFVNTPPSAAFEIQYNVDNTIIASANNSVDIDGNIMQWIWSIKHNDISPIIIDTSHVLNYTFAQGGFYNLTLIVIDNFNMSSKPITQMIFVNKKPKVDFTIVAVINSWVIVNADNILSNTGKSQDDDGSIVSLIWDFGDDEVPILNTTHSAQSHFYNRPGNFTIALYAVDNLNASSLISSQTIEIKSAPFANYYPILGAMYKQFVKLIHGKFVGRRFIVRLNGWVVYPFHICCQTFLRVNTLAAALPLAGSVGGVIVPAVIYLLIAP
ncbi:MAG: PKD domain-containing protein, partial [Pedobacter sp.]